MMKAWIVRVPDEWCSTVVFAETRGKARSIAMHTDTCEDCKFIDIEVRRIPHMDKYYRGLNEIALVKECGFRCSYEMLGYIDCSDCPAKQYCNAYVERSNNNAED